MRNAWMARSAQRGRCYDGGVMTVDELRAEMLHGFSELRAQIKAEGETTRRHFDVMVEKMSDSVKIVAESTSHHATRINDHEGRLKQLERPRRR